MDLQTPSDSDMYRQHTHWYAQFKMDNWLDNKVAFILKKDSTLHKKSYMAWIIVNKWQGLFRRLLCFISYE